MLDLPPLMHAQERPNLWRFRQVDTDGRVPLC